MRNAANHNARRFAKTDGDLVRRLRWVCPAATRRILLALSMTVIALASSSNAANAASADDLQFRNTLDLLDAEMQLKTLQILEKRGHFIPSRLWEHHHDRYTELAKQLRNASGADLSALDERLDEARKVHQAENEALRKLAVSMGRRILQDTKASAEFVHTLQAKMTKFEQKRSMTAVEVARFIETELANTKDRRDEWGRRARAIYRGSLKDQQNLFDAIVQREKDLLLLESYVTTLKNADRLIEAVQKSPADHAKDWMNAQLEKKLLQYLHDRYDNVDDENVKWAVGKAKKLVKSAWSTAGQWRELGNDASLRSNQTALATARQFAVLSAIYSNTLGVVRDLKVTKALGPLFDVLDFYGQTIALVPTVAQKLGATYDRAHQEYVAVANLSDWKILPVDPYEIRETTLMRQFNILIATGGELTEGNRDARYFLLVDRRGYVEFNDVEYQRLLQAVSAERIVNARSEASRSLWDYGLSFLSGDTDNNIFSSSVASSYLKDLRQTARQTPFTDRDLENLARGTSAELDGEQVTAASLADDRDVVIRELSVDALVREAMSEYRQEYCARWYDFEDVLRKHEIALSRDQIVRLFNFYARSSNRGMLDERLQKIADERAERRRGRLKAGVVTITTPDGDVVKPGAKVILDVLIVASDLAPGAQVTSQVVWSLPEWARNQEGSQPVIVRNGLLHARRDLSIPASVEPVPFQVTARLVAPVPHEQTAPYDRVTAVLRFDRGPQSLPERYFRLIRITNTSYLTKGKSRGDNLDVSTQTIYLPVLIDSKRTYETVLKEKEKALTEAYGSKTKGNWREELPRPYDTVSRIILFSWQIDSDSRILRPPFRAADIPAPTQSVKSGGGPQW